jgi:hypothetical protein
MEYNSFFPGCVPVNRSDIGIDQPDRKFEFDNFRRFGWSQRLHRISGIKSSAG